MTNREIAAAFKELYDADVSPVMISKVTDPVMEQVEHWASSRLTAGAAPDCYISFEFRLLSIYHGRPSTYRTVDTYLLSQR